MENGICFGMFAKYWCAGQVKTRLAQAIGDQAAAQVYRVFLISQCHQLGGIGDSMLVYSPFDRLDEFREFLSSQPFGEHWELLPQVEGDLGTRMQEFFRVAMDSGYSRVVLVGSDTPTLPRSYVEAAFRLLQDKEVVLGPTSDGGYYLVGARENVPQIFREIDWSTSHVWDQTIQRLQDRRVSYGALPEWYDVDDLADLKRLLADLADLKIHKNEPTCSDRDRSHEVNEQLRNELQRILGPDFE